MYYNMSDNEGGWWVPLSFTSQAKLDFVTTRPSHWIKGEESIHINDLKAQAHHWVMFNIKETGKPIQMAYNRFKNYRFTRRSITKNKNRQTQYKYF